METDDKQADLRLAPLVSEQARAVRDLYLEYRENPYSEAQIASLLEAMPGFGAWIAGELIGFVYFEPLAPDIVELGSIYVRRDMRDQGIGAKLMDAAVCSARDAGHIALLVSNSLGYATREPKQKARRFYLAQGFDLIFETEKTDLLLLRLV